MSLGDFFDTLRNTAPVKLIDDAVSNIASKYFGGTASSRNRDTLRAEIAKVNTPEVQRRVKEQVEREKDYSSRGEKEDGRKARTLLVAAETRAHMSRSASNLLAIELIKAMKQRVKGGSYSDAQLKNDTEIAVKNLSKNSTIIDFEKTRSKKEAPFGTLAEIENSDKKHIAAMNKKLKGISAMTVFDYLALKRATEAIKHASGGNLDEKLDAAMKELEQDNNMVDARRYSLAHKLCDMEEQ